MNHRQRKRLFLRRRCNLLDSTPTLTFHDALITVVSVPPLFCMGLVTCFAVHVFYVFICSVSVVGTLLSCNHQTHDSPVTVKLRNQSVSPKSTNQMHAKDRLHQYEQRAVTCGPKCRTKAIDIMPSSKRCRCFIARLRRGCLARLCCVKIKRVSRSSIAPGR